MNEGQQRTLAVWTVFVAPFVFLVAFLSWHDTLPLEVIAIYWLPPIVLTILGAICPPWTIVSRDSEQRS